MIYASESCCICLEESPEQDTMFYACGHQCAHAKCAKALTDCPFCRQHIAAKLLIEPGQES